MADSSLFDDRRLDRLRRQVMNNEEAKSAVADIEFVLALNTALAARHAKLAKALAEIADGRYGFNVESIQAFARSSLAEVE